MLKTGFILGASNLAIAVVGLMRNILLARLLSVDDFGIASTFAMTMALVEMTGNIALDRLLIQAPDGEAPALQATAQTLLAARGALGAAFLFLLAGPIAQLFGVPDVAWAYRALALVPLMRGLMHLDMYRLQRSMHFALVIKTELTAIVISTLAAVPLVLWLNDYSAMLYAILLQQALLTANSHMFAKRPYRWDWNEDAKNRAFRFGWPLFLNGMLMFGIFHGDRIIVGGLIGTEALGLFSAAFTLTLVPTLVIAKTLNAYFLPQLSKVQDSQKEFYHLYLVTVQAALLIGVLFALAFAAVGPSLMLALYGMKYEPAFNLLIWLAIMQAVRLGKAGAAIVATAKAETKNPLIANLIRIAVFPVTWLVVQNGAGLLTVVVFAIVGETLAFSASVYMLNRRLRLPIRPVSLPIIVYLLTLALIGGGQFEISVASYNLLPEYVGLVALILLLVWSMSDLRKWLRSLHAAH